MPIEFKHELLEDRVLVLPDPVDEQTSSGIYMPKSAQKISNKGTVIAVGKGTYARDTGKLIEMWVKKGDRVIFDKGHCEQFEDYLIMFETSIKCILHE